MTEKEAITLYFYRWLYYEERDNAITLKYKLKEAIPLLSGNQQTEAKAQYKKVSAQVDDYSAKILKIKRKLKRAGYPEGVDLKEKLLALDAEINEQWKKSPEYPGPLANKKERKFAQFVYEALREIKAKEREAARECEEHIKLYPNFPCD